MNIKVIANGLDQTVFSVILALTPLVLIFLIFQVMMLKLPRMHVLIILKGTFVAAIGLLFFIQGVHIAFIPFGRTIGEALGGLPYKWFLVLIGMILGFLTTWGEPSVRILADQVEEASSGSINNKTILYSVCAGVSVFVGIGMLRIIYGIPLLYILVPGYTFFLITMWFSDKNFLAIAIDSGGATTGPIANTFILAVTLGVASSLNGKADPLITGLGMVAMIALAPILSVLIAGFIVNFIKRRENV